MRPALQILAAALLVVNSGLVRAQPVPPGTLGGAFRVDFRVHARPAGAVIDGYVYNGARMSAERMRLRIEQLDASGRAVRGTAVWVAGAVAAGGRGYFSARVSEAPGYRVRVESFEWVGCGDG